MRTLKDFELERLRAYLRILMSKCIGDLCMEAQWLWLSSEGHGAMLYLDFGFLSTAS